jgi:hypothetical protein
MSMVVKQRQSWVSRRSTLPQTSTPQSARLRCKGMSSPPPSAAHVLECTSVKFSVHEQRDVKLPGQRRRTGSLQHKPTSVLPVST